jgi:hypothetical protein
VKTCVVATKAQEKRKIKNIAKVEVPRKNKSLLRFVVVNP